jgi:hypothetical protein
VVNSGDLVCGDEDSLVALTPTEAAAVIAEHASRRKSRPLPCSRLRRDDPIVLGRGAEAKGDYRVKSSTILQRWLSRVPVESSAIGTT